jgi:hypothetical protein
MMYTENRNEFEVTADLASGTTKICLIQDGHEIGSVRIDTDKSSVIAANILTVAAQIFQAGSRPNPGNKDAEATIVVSTGCNAVPGRTPGKSILTFYFGETVLGIEVPNSHALLLSQRLATLCAEGTIQ